MLSSNYHTHTKRCGHAVGEDEDYVLEAISYGYKNLGFSDHAMLPGFSEPGIRGDYSEFDGYVRSIRSLAEKYRNRITIYCGFEAESFPEFFPYYQELLNNGVLDYLILGNHCAMGPNHSIQTRFSHVTTPQQLYLYKDLAVQAMATKMFSVFAHPDYFMAGKETFDLDCRKVSKAIIEAAIAYDVPLEVNVGGIRDGKHRIGSGLRWIYPTDAFFDLVGKYQAKCIIGMDAHAPNQLSNDSAIFEAVKFAKRHNLVLVDSLPKIIQH